MMKSTIKFSHRCVLFLAFLAYSISSDAQWTSNGPSGKTINALTSNGTSVFAGSNANGLYISSDNGDTWSNTNTGLTSNKILSLCVNGNNIYAGTGLSGGVFISTNNGANWAASNSGLSNLNVFSFQVITQSFMFAGTAGGVYKSLNGGSSWTLSSTGISTLTTIRAFAYSSGPSLLYTGTNGGGTYKSFQGSSHASMGSMGINFKGNNVYALLIKDSILFGGTESGLYKSCSNNSCVWLPDTNGLPANPFIFSIAASDSLIFVATGGSGIYMSADNGDSWTAVNTGLPTATIFSLTVSGSYLFAGTYLNGVWRRPLSEFNTVTANKENLTSKAFTIYPNPSTGRIEISGITHQGDLKIYNLIGELILEKNIEIHNTSIDVREIPAGTYILNYIGKDMNISKKLLINR